MRKRTCLLILATLGILAPVVANPEGQTKSQSVLLSDLGSSDWQVRYEALERLKAIPRERLDAPIKDKLIQLLEFETRRVWDRFEKRVSADLYPEIGGEGFAEYYAALIGAVLNLHEKRALPALVAAASEPYTDFNVQLASFGVWILKPVEARLKELAKIRVTLPYFEGVQSHSQAAMADILAHVLSKNRNHELQPELSDQDFENIGEAVRPLLSSPNRWTQLYGAFALAILKDSADRERVLATFTDWLERGDRQIVLRKILQLPDPQFVPLAKVKELAEKDEFRIEKKTPEGKTYVEYPVRSLASQVLVKFSRKGGPRDD